MDHLGNLDIRALAIARRSAAPKAWEIGPAEELTREDMVLLVAGDAPRDPRAPLARISAPHHMLARLVAEGKENAVISAITGYTPGRIGTLKGDPAFQDLVAHYEAEIVKTAPDITARVAHLALTAGELLQERLETEPESFTKKELRELMTAGLDRIGHGPTSKHMVQVNDPSNVIRNLAEALSAESRGKIIPRETIEAEYTVTQTQEPANVTPPSGSRPEVGEDGSLGPVSHSAQAERSSGRGATIPEESPRSAGAP